MDKFAENLKKFMELRQFDQVKLAKKSGVPQSSISGYLRRDKRGKTPHFRHLIALAKALSCSLEELTGFEGFHKIEEKAALIKEPSEEQKLLLEAYETLPDDHWLKQAINEILLKGIRNKKGG
jgi:transcriptional regulator with XRE-family HTH domain